MGDFGSELARLMEARGTGMRELARLVPCNPGHISNLRSGRDRPSAEMAARLDALLGAGGTLHAAVAALGSRRGQLSREPAGQPDTPDLPGPVPAQPGREPGQVARLTMAPPAHFQEILTHLREQWHALVKTDNLLGPRFALAGVLNQIAVVEALRSVLRGEQRIEVARVGAKYAESAGFLFAEPVSGGSRVSSGPCGL